MTRYLVTIAASPRQPTKHGVADEDMLHAVRNAMAEWEFDDFTMLVGPARNADLLEVGVIGDRDR